MALLCRLRSSHSRRLLKPNDRILRTIQSHAHGVWSPIKTSRIIRLEPHQFLSIRSVTATAFPAATEGSTQSVTTKKKKDDSNIFLDNLGTIFLSAIGLIIGSLVRSSYGTSNRTKIRDELEANAVLDPLEIDDLRVANSELTPEVFRSIMMNLRESFPHGTATYLDFVTDVRRTMAKLKGDAFTVELGHYLDRVVLAALKEQGLSEENQVPLLFLVTALTLALHSTVPDRIQILYEALQLQNESVTYENVLEMVGNLQHTCQLVPDAQIVESTTKYPTQQYHRGSPKELVKWQEGNGDPVLMDVDAFSEIIRSKSVCAWGECYIRKKASP